MSLGVGSPDLTISKTHGGSFTQGQTGATYSITASNVGSGPSVGTITMTDTLPIGLTATAISGTGWSCTLGTLHPQRCSCGQFQLSRPYSDGQRCQQRTGISDQHRRGLRWW